MEVTNKGGTPPRREDYESLESFARAHEHFYDEASPTALQTLERAVRLAEEAVTGVELQCKRITDTAIDDWTAASRNILDWEFLIFVLWRLRLLARLAVSVDVTGRVEEGLRRFEDAVPELEVMRHVGQHLDEYAVDFPKRRQMRPGTSRLVGRRSLEVSDFGKESFHWLGGTIELTVARTAAAELFAAIQQGRVRA